MAIAIRFCLTMVHRQIDRHGNETNKDISHRKTDYKTACEALQALRENTGQADERVTKYCEDYGDH
ncbi:hypothetical protein P5673_001342 [Acropora cervicornis]|uniref:Uncharacterized protein n=1 Tax=Acropora cervicornis TaxID=6130 RepID=A0AAD9R5U7_ACRCE|nr:hypothetical protein P5673_001342 [Acropora cervicornis]